LSPRASIGLAKPDREVVAAAEQARHQEVEQRPQLAEVVLDRGARQAHAVAGGEPAHRLGDLRAVVLDRVGLVEHEQWSGTVARWSRSRATSG